MLLNNVNKISNMDKNKYIEIWEDVLPKILRVLKEDKDNGVISLDDSRFFNVGDRKKSGYTFRLDIINGVVPRKSGSAVARDLKHVLDSSIEFKKLAKDSVLLIQLNKEFKLQIYHSTPCPKSTNTNANKPKVEVKKTQSSKTRHIKGLDPVYDENSQILILGTMPGKDSLEKQEYYASASNSFWYIMAELFNGGKIFLNYDEKISCLKKNKIALWDIYHSCDRESSADKDIRNEVYNDINKFIKENPSIKHVVFNGKKASTVQINVDSSIAISTSNANPMSKENKVKAWKSLLEKFL